MIISKKRFQREVRREALKLAMTEQLQHQEEVIRRLKVRIKMLEENVTWLKDERWKEKEEKGSIHGYYVNRGAGDIVLCSTDEKRTEPEG